jgi:hypothetical protein
MKRAALTLTGIAVLSLAASQALAKEKTEVRFAAGPGEAQIQLVNDWHHHHGHYDHRGYYGYSGYRAPVVVYPRVYAYPPPTVVVPAYPPPPPVVYPPAVYPPAVVAPPPYYQYPRSYFEYRGRGLSFGVGL